MSGVAGIIDMEPVDARELATVPRCSYRPGRAKNDGKGFYWDSEVTCVRSRWLYGCGTIRIT